MTEELEKLFDNDLTPPTPNNAIYIDGVNVKDCERRIGKNNFCRYFKRNCADNNYNCIWKKCLRLEQELKWANDEEKYLKDCCIKAGKELEKNSFAWDGKEKNLVVQALELNKRYEILKQENKDLKKQIESDKGLITIGGKQQYDMTMAYDKCKTALEEIREIFKKQLPIEVIQGRFPMIYYSEYFNREKQIIDKINECLNS